MSDGLKDRVRALYAAVNAEDLATVEAVDDPELRSFAPRVTSRWADRQSWPRSARCGVPSRTFSTRARCCLPRATWSWPGLARDLAAPHNGAADPPSTWNREENVADDGGEGLVRRYYEEALNLGRFDRLDDLLTEEFVDHEELRGIPRPATA